MTNNDGTEVDEDEIMLEFGQLGEVLILLRSDEVWSTASTTPTATPAAETYPACSGEISIVDASYCGEPICEKKEPSPSSDEISQPISFPQTKGKYATLHVYIWIVVLFKCFT